MGVDDGIQIIHLECPIPAKADVMYGKMCQPNCINGNKAYSTLKVAWDACKDIPECGFVMAWNDGKFYLRRSSDQNVESIPGKPRSGYFFRCGK